MYLVETVLVYLHSFNCSCKLSFVLLLIVAQRCKEGSMLISLIHTSFQEHIQELPLSGELQIHLMEHCLKSIESLHDNHTKCN